jgi:uncharacterized protein (TIGR02996 family)
VAKKAAWPNRPEVLALLRTCKEALDDDAPRLVLADWLEEAGEADRAELIRLQCRIETLDFDVPDYYPVSGRIQELCAKHKAEWFGAFPARPWGALPSRGLLTVELPPRNFWVADRLALAGTETWAWVERFNVATAWMYEEEDHWRFLRSPVALDIASIDLRGARLTADDVRALADAARPLPLRGLSLAGSDIDTAKAQALVSSQSLTGLTELDLKLTQIGPDACALLGGWPVLGQLRVLSAGYNELRNKGVAALVTSQPLKELRRLNLSSSRIDDAGARAIARANLTNLTRLDLIHNGIKARGVTALAGSPALAKLTWLELSVSDRMEGAGDAGVCAIAESPHMSKLAHLGLKENSVGDEAAVALARSPHLFGLRTLDVEHNPMGERGALALAEAPWLDNLMLLDIGANPIGRKAARALRKRLGARVKLDPGMA